MPALQSEERLGEAAVSSLPHMTEEGRQETLDGWRELAGIDPSADVETVQWADFVKEIKGRSA
jgi:hypothetical protein